MAQRGSHRRRRPAKAAPPPRLLELEIETLGARGDGVARREGREIFVPCTLAGERVRAEAADGRAVLKEIVEASPSRVAAPCVLFGECGGCAVQHMAQTDYYAWKRERVREALRRAGLDESVVGEVVAVPTASRRRAVFAVRRAGGGALIGFNARASRRVVDIEGACLILHPELRAGLPRLKRFCSALPPEWRAFDMTATLCENGLDVALVGAGSAEALMGPALERLAEAMRAAKIVRFSLDGDALLTLATPVVRFSGAPATFPPGGFLQASEDGEALMAEIALRAAGGARRILDLFCGAGSFSLPLSAKGAVHGADSDGAAIEALADSARLAGRHSITAEVRNLFERPFMADELNDYDLAVFDPPRAGAAAQAAELARARVPRIIGVSCNPATFARDAALLAQGGYRLRDVTPVDQFVYASHIELVGIFERGG